MLCFHGMTESAFKYWIQGKESYAISPWIVSDNDGCTYLHTIEHALEETGDSEYAKDFAIRQAKESAIIQAAMNNDNGVFVIEIEVPDSMLNIDYSCDNMQHCRYITESEFNALRDKARIHSFSVNSYLHIFRIAGLLNNRHFNKYALDEEIVEAAQIVSNTDFSDIYDSLFD